MHLNKQGKVAESIAETMENVEGHLRTLNDHMKKLIEIQQKNVTEGGRTTNVPVAPRMDSGVAPSAAAKAATLGTTGRAAKAMPVAPEAVPAVGPPLPMPPAPPLLNQGLRCWPCGADVRGCVRDVPPPPKRSRITQARVCLWMWTEEELQWTCQV